MARVLLKPRKARPFFGRHPWVLDSAVESVEGQPADGDVVDLVSHQGNFIARGIINSKSRIRVRLYTWQVEEQLDAAFWRRRLAAAVQLREAIGYTSPQGACRLVFSEGDGLSGLIVDRYGQYLAVQATSLAMARRLEQIVPILVELTGARGAMLRTEKGIAKTEGIDLRDGPFWGEMPAGPIEIVENGLRLRVDFAEGQKTGYYLDQRENRRAVAGYVRGRRMLDMFCYSGGFSLAAAAFGEAREVLGIDASQRAVELARANADLNGLTNVRFDTGNCFEVLESLHAQGERFGAIVLDPPKFARSRRNVDEAMRAYHSLNRLGIALLDEGGILVTCSCSGSVTREDFVMMLLGVAQQSGREIQILDQRGASPDHPVEVTCLESEYLKCFICRVV